MSFKSSYGNYKTNEEYLSRIVETNQNDIPVFGTNGKIESVVNVPIDSNLYIKGGHKQYDTYEEIENIPSNQRIAGMEVKLNSSIDLTSTINTNNIPVIATQANNKAYIISSDQVVISDPIQGTNTFISISNQSKYLVGNDGSNFLYFSNVNSGTISEFSMSSNTMTRTASLPDVEIPDFISSGYLTNGRLFLGDQNNGSNFLYYINLSDFSVGKIKSTNGTTDFVALPCATWAHDTTQNKLYLFGAGPSANLNNNIYVIDVVNAKIITTISASSSGLSSQMYTGSISNSNTFLPVKNKIYAVSRNTDKLFSINTNTYTIEDIINLPTGSNPSSMYLVNTTLYIGGFTDGNVYVVDLLTNTIKATIYCGSGVGGGLGQLSYYQNRLFVPNLYDASISVINTVSNTLVGTFNVGGLPRGISYVEATSNIYVPNQGATSFSVLSYKPGETYSLQQDLETWENNTSISKNGDYVKGILNYSNDYSPIFNDRSIPDIAYIRKLIETHDAYEVISGTSWTLSNNKKYIANSTSLLTFTLPTTSKVGDWIIVVGRNNGKWRIRQNDGQIIVSSVDTTQFGATGYIDANNQFDTIKLVCLIDNARFVVEYSMGNLLYR